jgi:signal transduction histidine kinase
VAERPFEKYAKGPNSTGKGLGLAFAEAVVRAHGGQILASNGPLGGAIVVIDLPLADPASLVDRASAQEREPIAGD